MEQNMMSMDKKAYDELKKLHEQSSEGDIIEYEGNEIDYKYLGYVLEYAEMKRPQWKNKQ